MADGKIRLKVRLFKYRDSGTGRLLGMKEGGSSVLATFIGAYKRETARFAGSGLTNPIVILYDNDDGARPINGVLKKILGAPPTGAEPFVHVFKNLYAVATPLGPNAAPSMIEDFFEDNLRQTVLVGKTFNPDNGFDSDKHYGKKVFAHRVVRPHADKINFAGFRPLLTNLVAAIQKHKASMAKPTS